MLPTMAVMKNLLLRQGVPSRWELLELAQLAYMQLFYWTLWVSTTTSTKPQIGLAGESTHIVSLRVKILRILRTMTIM